MDTPVIPAGVVAVQVYIVPVGTTSGATFVGVTVKVLPVQIATVTSAISGSGLTVTVMVKVSVQTFGAVPTEAVTVYTTSIELAVALLSV